MSHPARDPRSGIAGQASVTNRRLRGSAFAHCDSEALT